MHERSGNFEDLIERYCMGQIVDDGEVAAVEEHLLCCEACQKLFHQTNLFVSTFREARRWGPPKPPILSRGNRHHKGRGGQ